MHVRHRLRSLIVVAVSLGLGVLGTLPALAQQTGEITGSVTSAETLSPLTAVQVFVPGSGVGTLSDDDGNYRMQEVPAGEQTVRAQLIGYGQVSRTVTVEPGQTVTVNFELERSAIALDQIVVTGTGTGGIERKRLGNTVGTINASEVEDAPTNSFSEVLSAREAGVQVLPSSGIAGEGAAIRIRGSASVSQSNEPIVYVDGVRVNNGGGFGPGVSAGAAGAGGSSRLDDIDPNSIERVEILKGAAAATLFGTEASNGVIQIFTKSGTEGATRWTFEVQQGLESLPTGRMITHADFPRDQAEADRMNSYWNASVEPFEVLERDLLPEVRETGRTSNFSGSMSGGTSGITYFASGRYQNLDGPFGFKDLGPARDRSERINGTANLNIFPNDKLRLRLRTNYANTDQRTPDTSNNIYAPYPLLFHSQLRLASANNKYGTPVFATVREAMQRTTGQEVEHFGGSFTTSYLPSQSLTLNATFGVDVTSDNSEEVIPFGWDVDDFTGDNVAGERGVASLDRTEITLDLQSVWETQLSEDFSSSLTTGGQGFVTSTTTRGGTGTNFPGPGLNVAGAAANQSLLETFLRNVNVGVLAQEQIGYRDYAFLTLGARFDANSAFGEEFSGVFYPKASLSVIPSDMPDWNSGTVSTLRLRGAIGRSGLQPGAFDKFRTFSALPSTEGAGIEPSNLGNQELEPEVSTEWEAGTEVGLFNDRAALEATYWNRTVSDMMVPKQFPVSGGFNQVQLDNIGESKAWGLDLAANGTVYSGDDISVDMFVNASYLSEEVTDLGGAPPLKVSGSYPRNRNFVREGYAPGSFFGATLADAEVPLDLAGDCSEPTRQEALTYFSQPRDLSEFEVIPAGCGSDYLSSYLGKPIPDWQGSLGTNISFLQNFTLNTMFEYKFGNFFVQDLSGAFRQANAVIGRNTPETSRISATMLDPSSTAEERLDAALLWANEYRALAPMSGMNQIWPADFLRWRELSLTWDTPTSFASRLAMDRLSISLRARNLSFWVNDEYRGTDPELNNNARCTAGDLSCNFLLGQEAWRVPIPRRFILAVRARF